MPPSTAGNTSNHRQTRQNKQRITATSNADDNEELIIDTFQTNSGIEHSILIAPGKAGILREWFFDGQDTADLCKNKKSDLVELCMQRGIEIEGSKQDLVEALFQWRKYALPLDFQPKGLSKCLFAANEFTVSMPNLSALNLASPVSSLDSVDINPADLENQTGSADTIEELSTEVPEAMGDGNEIALSEVRINKVVGSGAYKTVHRAIYKKCLVALSIISTQKLSKSDLEDIEHEVDLLKQLRHDNIVRFLGIVQDKDADVTDDEYPEKIYIMTEFCPFGDLSDYMKSRSKPGWPRILTILHDIAFGVSYLHGRRPAIIHRDLKSLNILVDSKENVKIADFGLSKTRSKLKARMHTVVGTINWQAPEMWLDKPQYTERVDVYSCGLIFWEILNWSNTYPFGELSDAQIYDKGIITFVKSVIFFFLTLING